MVNTNILFLSAISIFATTGSAANCYGNNPKASIDASWSAREAYCGSGLWKNQEIYTLDGVQIHVTAPGSNTQQICWDAFENIIDQCRKNGKFGMGIYVYGDTKYNMSWL